MHISDAVFYIHVDIPDYGKSSSRKNENTGDGYYLCLKGGSELIDMEIVEFDPSGMFLLSLGFTFVIRIIYFIR